MFGKARNVCVRRAILVAWGCSILVLVLRGLTRAPEVSVCSFVKSQLKLSCEEHLASTKDGYQLYMKRIPQKGPPVLLMPGLADSSATWVVSGENSLGSVLHDAGYDVWLLEKRGRTPWRHERYTGQDLEFWDFSFDENIRYDMPALVEYVRRFTGQEIGSVVGHSEGAMVALASMANDPQTAEHVKSVVALAPPIGSWGSNTMANMPRMPIIPNLIVDNVHPAIPLGFTRLVFAGLCAHAPGLCWNAMCLIAGCADSSQYDGEVVGNIFSYYPRETSLKNLQHLTQCQHAGVLQHFDHGEEKNLELYGSKTPQPIEFSGLKTPTALFFGTKDLVVPADTYDKTRGLLPEQAIRYVNTSIDFGHQDFLWGMNAKEAVYDSVVDFIRNSIL